MDQSDQSIPAKEYGKNYIWPSRGRRFHCNRRVRCDCRVWPSPRPFHRRPSQEGIEADPRPQSLIDFANANNNAKAAYESEDNELRQTAIKKQRDSEVAAAIPGGNFEGWTGTVQEIGEAGEDGTISIQPDGCECTVETYNNSFSDSLSGRKTIIKKNSRLFELLMSLHKGDNVIFSGHIIEERSITESGSVQEPAWIASFSEISATE